MSRLLIGTNTVFTNEPCYLLVESNEVAPDYKGWHRYQTLTVIRNDRKVEFRRSLGPVEQFKVPVFQIIGGATDYDNGRIYIEETVGSLIEMANYIREGPFTQPEPPPTRDLIGAYYDQPEIRRKARKKQSTFGPGAVLQRS